MEKTHDEEMAIDLWELISALKKRALIILAACLLGGVVAGVYTKLCITPMYTATSSMLVTTQETTLTSIADLQLGSALTGDYSILATSRSVLEEVIEDLGLNMNHHQLRGSITITNPEGTHIMEVTARSSDPETAKKIADTMADKISMNTQDAVSANFAECFVTLNGTRYSMLMAKEFEGKASINTKEVYRLGNPVIGHKAQTIALAFSMTVYKCTEIFDQVVEDFIKTGVMPTFDIQTSNDDPATSVGRSTKIYNNCVLDGDVLLSMFNAEGDFVEQTLEGYCDSFTRPEKHTNPSYM